MENPVIKKESQQISLLHLCREEVRKAVVDKCKQTMICLLPAADYSTMLLFKYKLTWFFFFLFVYLFIVQIFQFLNSIYLCGVHICGGQRTACHRLLSFHHGTEGGLHGKPLFLLSAVPFSIALPGQSTIWPESVTQIGSELYPRLNIYQPSFLLIAKLYSTRPLFYRRGTEANIS